MAFIEAHVLPLSLDGRVHVESVVKVQGCAGCGTRAHVKDRRPVALVDLPAFGRPTVLVWHNRRWRCPDADCATATWTETDPRIAASRGKVTDRAGRWVCAQVGRDGRAVSEVARQLGCDWHTVMDAVTAYGAPLIEDPDRIGPVTALGLDETLFARTGPWRTRSWSTAIVDVGRPSQLLDIVQGRTAKTASTWIDARPQAWRDDIAWATLDLSGPYRKAFDDSLPDATQIADPFHVVKLANTSSTMPAAAFSRTPRSPGPQGRPALPVPPPAHQGPRAPRRQGRSQAARLPRRRRPTRRRAPRVGMPRRPYAASTPSTTPPRPRPTSTSSSMICSTRTTRPRSEASAGRFAAGAAKSWPGTRRRSPTGRPKQRTT